MDTKSKLMTLSNIDTQTPLNREELAAYFTAMNQMVMNGYEPLINNLMERIDCIITGLNTKYDQILIKLDEAMRGNNDLLKDMIVSQVATTKANNKIAEVNNKIAEAITESGKKSRSQIAIINNQNKKPAIDPVFNSVKDLPAQNNWAKIAEGAIAMLARNTNLSEANILNMIYESMKKEGYSTKDIYSRYKRENPKDNRITMISRSDVLSALFSKAYFKLYSKYVKDLPISEIERSFADALNDGSHSSHRVSRTSKPKAIKNENFGNNYARLTSEVAKLSSTGVVRGRVYHKAFNIVNDKCGMSVKDEAAKIISSRHLMKSTPVVKAISHDDQLTEIVINAITDSLGGNKSNE